MNKGFIKKLVIIIFFFSLPYIIVDLFLYIDNYQPDYKTFTYKINNINYNFNENPKKYLNDNNDEKIIFLGDSMTQGTACASKKKDFVNHIKLQWGINHKSSIYNFGSGGRGPADYFNIYNHLKYKNLRRAIVVLYFNDIQISFGDCLTFGELSKNGYPKVKMCDLVLEKKIDHYNDTILKRIDNVLEKTRIWIFIKNRLASVSSLQKYFGRIGYADSFQNQQSKQFILFLDILKRLQTDAIQNGIIIDFLYFPDVYYLNEKAKPYKAWQFFINVAKTEGIIINDPWEYFMENKDSDNMSWSLIDFHPNCKAHKIMANYIVENIL